MKRFFLIQLCLLIFLILSNPVSADCMMVDQFDNFLVMGDRTVILYRRSVPLARLDVDCPVRDSSIIRLLTAYLCDGDAILIDGSKCQIYIIQSTY